MWDPWTVLPTRPRQGGLEGAVGKTLDLESVDLAPPVNFSVLYWSGHQYLLASITSYVKWDNNPSSLPLTGGRKSVECCAWMHFAL